MPKIRLCHADGTETKFGLAGKLFTIGRAGDNDIVLPGGTSSNYHAVLKITPSGDFSLTDLGSTNHTRVNGKRITTRDLRGGDRILFGDAVAFYESEITPEDAPDEDGSTTRRLPASGDTVLSTRPAHGDPDDNQGEGGKDDEDDEEAAAARRRAKREARREKLGRTKPPSEAGDEAGDRAEEDSGRSGGGCLGIAVAAALVALTLGIAVAAG